MSRTKSMFYLSQRGIFADPIHAPGPRLPQPQATQTRPSKPRSPSSIYVCTLRYQLPPTCFHQITLVLASQVKVKSVGRERLGGHLLKGHGEEVFWIT